jgi:hypothetical protein
VIARPPRNREISSSKPQPRHFCKFEQKEYFDYFENEGSSQKMHQQETLFIYILLPIERVFIFKVAAILKKNPGKLFSFKFSWHKKKF